MPVVLEVTRTSEIVSIVVGGNVVLVGGYLVLVRQLIVLGPATLQILLPNVAGASSIVILG